MAGRPTNRHPSLKLSIGGRLNEFVRRRRLSLSFGRCRAVGMSGVRVVRWLVKGDWLVTKQMPGANQTSIVEWCCYCVGSEWPTCQIGMSHPSTRILMMMTMPVLMPITMNANTDANIDAQVAWETGSVGARCSSYVVRYSRKGPGMTTGANDSMKIRSSDLGTFKPGSL